MERKSLIVLAVLETLAVVTPQPAGIDATAVTVNGTAAGQPAVSRNGADRDTLPHGCAPLAPAEIRLASPGHISL